MIEHPPTSAVVCHLITHYTCTLNSIMDVVALNRFFFLTFFSGVSNDVYKYFQTAVVLVDTYP